MEESAYFGGEVAVVKSEHVGWGRRQADGIWGVFD